MNKILSTAFALAFGACLLAPLATLHSAGAPKPEFEPANPAPERPSRPSVGAIRWDAWSGGRVTEEVQRTLGPAKYPDRLPWFAELNGDNQVRIDGGSPETMDREINFAADAGWDYWALDGQPNTTRLDAIRGVLAPRGASQHPVSAMVAPAEPRPASNTQYILFNRAPGQGMNQAVTESLGRKQFDEVLAHFPNRPGARRQTGVSYIFSPFRTAPDMTVAALKTFLDTAAQTDTPVLVQIDLEHWWSARPDLWNWWDPAKPGFNPANRENVEWTGWSPDDAVKIAWRNWGQQIRVLPPPNFASPRYTAACREEIGRLVPIVLDWHARLPADQKPLLVGIKLGHETSIGVNAYHYPGGNELLGQSATNDPARGLKNNDVLARGVARLGYAALKTSGLRTHGVPTESELRDVAQRYLEMLCREAAACGAPRERLFAHGAGWKDGELIYDVPVNRFSCPGWSFYQHAADPRQDAGVQRNLAKSDAPYWAAAEWLFQGKRETAAWRNALSNTLADPRCRYVCIFNWESIRSGEAVLKAISELVETSRLRDRRPEK